MLRAPGDRLLQSAVALLLAVSVGVRLWIGAHVCDDAYITFRYSRNLLGLGELVYNAGERVLGTTTPLYALLLAGIAALRIPLELGSVAIAAISDGATIVLGASVLRRAGLPFAGLAAGVAVALSPFYVTYSVSGMETSLYVALLTAIVWAVDRRRYALMGLLAGLVLLCRPDGLVMVALGCGLAARRDPRSGIRSAAIALAVCLPWLLIAWTVYGSAVPQSVIAKSALRSDPLTSWHNFAALFFAGKHVVVSAAAVAGLAVLWRSGSSAARLWLVWWLLYAAVFIVRNGFTYFPWYFVPLLPLYYGASAAAAELGARALLRAGERPRLVRGIAAASLLAISIGGIANLSRHRRFLDRNQAIREDIYAETGRRLAAANPNCTVAATEIGAIGWTYEGRILDLVGLVSPEAVGSDPVELLASSSAQWLVTYDSHFPRDAAASPGFVTRFELVRRVPLGETRALEVWQRRANPACAVPETWML